MSFVPFHRALRRPGMPGAFPGTSGRYNRRINLGRAARLRKFSATRTRNSRKRSTSGIGVTEQYDAKLVYRKRRMPRGRRRRWKAFSRKVLAVSEKDLGTQQVLFNIGVNPTNVISGNQLLFNCALYSMTSGTSYWNDMDQIGQYNAAAATTAATGLTVDPTTKIIFKSAVLDITVRNSSTYTADGSTYGINPSARMEVDVYEISVNRCDEEAATFTDLLGLLAQAPIRTQPIGGGATSKVALTSRGVTPFDLSYALSVFGIKIWKKTKYQLSNNEQFTYQIRDPRRHVMTQRELTSSEGPCKRGLTRCVLIVGRMAPGLALGLTTGTYQEGLQIGITRKYQYKVENWSEDRTAYATL